MNDPRNESSQDGSTARLSKQNKDAWSELYRSTPDLVWGGAPVGFLEPFLQGEIPAGKKFSRVLDAAAGEGRNLAALRRLGGELTACDASPEALAKIPSAAGHEVRRVRCDLNGTPFRDGEFDLILLSDIVETLPDPLKALREMARILAPGGQLICNIPGPEDGVAGVDMTRLSRNRYLYKGRFYYHFFEAAEATQLLADAGFHVLKQRVVLWDEGPHPEYRIEAHSHVSRVFLVGHSSAAS